MIRYVIQRLLSAILILLGVSVLTFAISHVIPADPARIAAGATAGPEQIEALRKAMGLDRPAPIQYLIYLQGILHFDLGRSIRTQQPVSEEIVRYLPATLELILFSFVLYTIIGISFGTIAAVRHNSWIDILIRVVSVIAFAVPVYVLGLWLLYGLYFQLGWFPGGGRLDIKTTPPPHITSFYLIDSLLARNPPLFLESLQHLLLPALTLTLGLLAVATRLTRSGMLNELNSKYVQVVRLKGVKEFNVVVKHALRNSLIPVFTLMGVQFGYLIGGTVIVETIFQWPGIGLYTFRAITSLDYAAVMGVTLIATFFFVMINLFLDLLYPVLDPRIAVWGERP